MKSLNKLGVALAVTGFLTLAGCGGMGSGPASSPSSSAGINAGTAAAGTGVVQSIEPVQQDGRTIQRITVRMDGSGNRQSVTNSSTAGFSVGDKVRIENGMMRKN